MSKSLMFALKLLLCVILALPVTAIAQTNQTLVKCGSQTLMDRRMKDPVFRQLHEQIEKQLLEYRKSGARNPNAVVNLPVVVHIVHNNGAENISDAAVIQGVQYLNQAFANTAPYDPSDGVDCQIQFCLARRDPNGNATTGITRNVSPLTNMDMDNDDISLKNLNRWDPRCYVNIWLVKEICSSGGCGVAGYAYLPSAHGSSVDGIVMEARWFGSSSGNAVVQVHEMGHYLGLYHTFQNGCSNTNCLTDGDRVCDTPPDQTTASVACNGTVNSCTTDALSGFTTDQNDLHRDYMDYGNLNCFSMFTQGQADRMNWHITNVRSSLLNCRSCLDPCPAPITANCTFPGATVNAGTSFTFVNSSSNAVSYEWYVNNVLQSTGINFTLNFSAIGTYTVKLVAKSGSALCGPDEKTMVIQAVCPVTVGFTKSAAVVPCGTNINFTNTSTNATAYEWYVNGALQATGVNFSYTNTIAGRYAIKLIARNTALNCAKEIVDTAEYTCSVTAAFTPLTQSVNVNTTINFTNTSTGATTYQWLVNNVPASIAPAFSYTPATPGNYIITLIAGNGFCSTTQSAYITANDTCLRTTFQKAFGGTGDDVVADVKYTTDGGYVLCGYTNSFGTGGGYDAIVIKTDSKGDPVWNKVIGGTGNDYLQKIIITRDGGYLAAGYTSSFSSLNVEGWMVRLDASGNVLWTRKYRDGNPNGSAIWDVCQTSDGGFAFAGVNEYVPTLADAMIGKTDANGVIQWCRYFSGTSSDQAYGVLEDNGVLVVSAFGAYLAGPYYDGVFMKLDVSNGNVLRCVRYDIENRSNWFLNLKKQGDDYLIGCNNNNDFSNTSFAYITLRLDTIGTVKQIIRSNSATDKSGSSLFTTTADGGILIAQSENNATADVHLRKSSSAAALEWTKKYGTPAGNERVYGLIQTPDLSFVGVGIRSAAGGNNDFYIIKTDVQGNAGSGCNPQADDGTNATPQYTTGAYQWPETGAVNIAQNNLVTPSVTTASLPVTSLCSGVTCVVDPDTCLKSFQRSIGGTGTEVANCIQKVPGGGYIISGRTNSFGAGNYDAYLVRTDPKGNVIWAKAYGGAGMDYFDQVSVTNTGGFIATGRTTSFANSTGALYVVNVDANGNLIWSRSLGSNTANGEDGHTIIQTSDGGFAIAGSYDAAPGSIDMLITKLDAAGNFTWSKRYNTGVTDDALSLIEENDSLVVAGYYRGITFHEAVLLKVNKNNGNLIWTKSYDVNTDNNGFYRIQKVPGGYSLLASSSQGFSNNGVKQVALRLDVNGNVIYTHQLSSSTNRPNGDRIYNTADGGYISINSEEGTGDVYLYKVNSGKQLVWKKKFTRAGNQNAYHIIEDPVDGSIVMAGVTDNGSGGTTDMLFIKTNPRGETPGCTVDSTDATVTNPIVAVLPYSPTVSTVTFTSVTPPATIVTSTSPVITTLCSNANCDSLRLPNDTAICLSGDTLVFRPQRGVNCTLPVQWQTDATYIQVINATDSLIKIKLLRSGSTTIYASMTGTCQYLTDSMQITINRPAGLLNLGPDIQLCTNSVITLRAGPGFRTYLWQDGAVDSTYTANFPGTYHVTVTDSCGNIRRDTVVIAVAPALNFDLGPDLLRCNDDTLTLTAPAGFVKYTWSPNYNISTTNTRIVKVWPAVDTSYTVVAEMTPGCLAYDTVHIRVSRSPLINLGNDTSFCQGGSLLLDAGSGFNTYVWSTGASGQTITASTAGTYWVRGTTVQGCISTDTLRILNVYPNPVPGLGNDTNLCQGATLLLNPGAGFAGYIWQDGSTNPTFTASAVGLYWVQVTSSNGCRSRDSLSILNIYPRPLINLGNDTSFCQGGSLLLDAGSGFNTYVWSTGASGQTITANAAGTYWVRSTTAQGCISTDTLRILNVYPNPVPGLGNDTSLCQGATLVLNPGAGFAGYIWQDGSTNPTFTASAVGLYWVQVTSSNGCRSRDSLSILNIYPRPLINLGNDTSFCQGGAVVLNAGGGFASYLWSTGASGQTITASTAGTYWVRSTTAQGCISTDTLRVLNVYPNPTVNLGADRVLCSGSSITLNAGNGFSHYLWQDNSTGPTFTTGSIGTYWVEVISANNCKGSDTMKVLRISPLPSGFVQPQTGMCLYEKIYVHSIGVYSTYLWSTGATKDSALISMPGSYWLEVTNADGCTARENFVVFDKNCTLAVYFPNVFSPNGDGRNDTYKPGVYGIPEYFRLEIFNRYGERVFVTTDYRKGWDGRYKGALQNTGGYVWMCTYQFKDKPVQAEKGSLLLVQ